MSALQTLDLVTQSALSIGILLCEAKVHSHAAVKRVEKVSGQLDEHHQAEAGQ